MRYQTATTEQKKDFIEEFESYVRDNLLRNMVNQPSSTEELVDSLDVEDLREAVDHLKEELGLTRVVIDKTKLKRWIVRYENPEGHLGKLICDSIKPDFKICLIAAMMTMDTPSYKKLKELVFQDLCDLRNTIPKIKGTKENALSRHSLEEFIKGDEELLKLWENVPHPRDTQVQLPLEEGRDDLSGSAAVSGSAYGVIQENLGNPPLFDDSTYFPQQMNTQDEESQFILYPTHNKYESGASSSALENQGSTADQSGSQASLNLPISDPEYPNDIMIGQDYSDPSTGSFPPQDVALTNPQYNIFGNYQYPLNQPDIIDHQGVDRPMVTQYKPEMTGFIFSEEYMSMQNHINRFTANQFEIGRSLASERFEARTKVDGDGLNKFEKMLEKMEKLTCGDQNGMVFSLCPEESFSGERPRTRANRAYDVYDEWNGDRLRKQLRLDNNEFSSHTSVDYFFERF